MGGLAGVPLVATAYRRLAWRRARRSERLFIVRTTVAPELINDLVDLVRKVRGRAALEGRDTVAVPLPDGAEENVAYRELRALLERWESLHPGIRLEIVAGPRQHVAAARSETSRRARRATVAD